MNPIRPTIAPGIYADMSAEDYHAAPALSKSTMDHLHKSPAHMLAYLQEPHKDTPEDRAALVVDMLNFGAWMEAARLRVVKIIRGGRG